MSYARNNGVDSDVYVFDHLGGGTVCCGCSVTDSSDGWFETDTHAEMVEHLKEHRRVGHRVPERAVERLLATEDNL